MPLIGVAPDKYSPGAESLDWEDEVARGVTALTVLPLEEAIDTCWETDAHMVCYQVVGLDTWSRINKVVLGPLRKAGAEVQVTVFFVDVDNPDHAPWTEELARDFVASVVDAVEYEPVLGEYHLFYPTRNGARFVYLLKDPLQPEEAEGHHRGLVQLWRRNGVNADVNCSDWTRLFRLPFVTRDGDPTWEEDWPFEIEWQKDKVLNARIISPVSPHEKSNEYAEIVPVDVPKPDPSEVDALMYETSEKTGKRVLSEWHKLAKRRLKNRDCYPCIFDDEPIASLGSRNETVQKFVGSACGLLYGVEDWVTPAHIYALFYPAVTLLEPDSGDPDWTNTLWRAVCRYWEGEDAQHRARKAREENREEYAASVQHQMLEGVREWVRNVPEVRGDDHTAFSWLLRHLIAITPNGQCHLMRADGYFDRMPVRREFLQVRLRSLDMQDVIPSTVMTAKDTSKPMTGQELVDAYGFLVYQVEGVCGEVNSYVEHIETDTPVLKIRLYGRRKDIEPRFDNDVDAWLRRLGGKDYDKLCAWIGNALAFDEGPIAALSIKGHPGSGKKMLVLGLAEAIDTETYCDGAVFGTFNDEILKSPFVHINEGWGDIRGGRDRADFFRHMVGGDPLKVEEKYRPRITCRIPARLIMTANNLDVVAGVFSHKDMSPEDRDSIRDRIFHIDANDDAKHWLRLKGGLKFTARPGNRWVGGDSGQRSAYVVARHFLWLYHAREAKANPYSNRLMVEGSMPDSLIRSMATRSGKAPIVVETVLHMIESPRFVGAVVDVSGGSVHVSSKAVLDHWRNQFAGKTRDSLTMKHVSSSLIGLERKNVYQSPEPYTLTVPGGMKKRARWRELDVQLLLSEAHEHGFLCGKLEKVVDAYEKSKVIEGHFSG